jgi:hypothetical protein
VISLERGNPAAERGVRERKPLSCELTGCSDREGFVSAGPSARACVCHPSPEGTDPLRREVGFLDPGDSCGGVRAVPGSGVSERLDETPVESADPR